MITIGIVLYNEEKHLELIRDNVLLLNQCADHFKIIILNNGSTDRTFEKLKHILVGQEIFKWIDREDNNLGAARAMVVEAAATDWVGFIDGDCMISQSWVEAIVRLKKKYETRSESGFGGPWVPDGLWQHHYRSFFNHPLVSQVFPHLHLRSAEKAVDHIPTSNVVYRKADVLAVGSFSDQFKFVGEDLDLSLKLKLSRKALVLHKDLAIGHRLPESMLGWCAKIFKYGCGRVDVAVAHKVFIDPVLILPPLLLLLAGGLFFWIGFLFFFMGGVSFLVLSWWSLSSQSSLVIVFGLFFLTPLSYALGMLFRWSEKALSFLKYKKKIVQQV